MRVLPDNVDAGQAGSAERIAIDFEGRAISCRRGETLAAALAAAGEMELRVARSGQRRGIYCGMGVCQECLVEIDGRSGHRACMTVVNKPVEVRRQTAESGLRPPVDPPPLVESGDLGVVEPEILVIGGGPGGLMAACVAAEAGAEVTLLDERPKLGGQFYKQPTAPDACPPAMIRDRQFADGRALIDRARRSGADLRSNVEIWGAFAPNEIAAHDGARSVIFRPRRIIVAAGAFERGLPLPGWTLPGVMTTGAAQTLLRSYGVLPGRRILVAGNGPLNLQVALELKQAGADIVAVAELARAPYLTAFHDLYRMATSAPGLLAKGARYLARLRLAGVPVQYEKGLASVEKTDSGLRAWIGRSRAGGVDADTAFDVDAVCMGYGFQPNNDILRSLDCGHAFDQVQGHLVTRRNDDCETTVPGIYAVGDCCGLGGAPAALEEGLIAATAVIESLGRPLSAKLSAARRTAHRQLRSHRRFQAALWRMFAAPRFQHELARPNTAICRCENVDLESVEAALSDGDPSIGEVKRRTRLGMGPCQGRYCAPIVAAMLAERQGRPIDEMAFFAPRAPVKPIRIADMVKAGGE